MQLENLTSDQTRRVAIIGGGISGLSAALALSDRARESGRAVDITLLESGDRLGGVLRTERIGEYLVEHAADMWITNKPEGVWLCERLGLSERLIPTDAAFRKSLVLRNGRAYPIPEGFQLMVPEQAWPVLRSPVLSWRGKLRLMAELFVPARRDGTDESLASFVRRRFGRETFERLVQPLVGGIYTADPERLSLLATLPRFLEMERQHGSLILAAVRARRERTLQANQHDSDQVGTSGARYGLFVSLPNGIGELIDKLVAVVSSRVTIRLQTSVTSVRTATERSRFEVALSDGSTQAFDAVILAVPAFVAASLLQDGACELATLLGQIEYASTVVVASGHKLVDIAHPLDAFGLVVPHAERRNILATSFTSRKFPGRAPAGRVLLRTFVGGALQPELAKLDDAATTDLVRRELAEILGVRGEPDFVKVLRHSRAMPQYHVGHMELVSRIQSAAARVPGFALAGSFLSGVGIPDSIASGEAAAKSVIRTCLTRQDGLCDDR